WHQSVHMLQLFEGPRETSKPRDLLPDPPGLRNCFLVVNAEQEVPGNPPVVANESNAWGGAGKLESCLTHGQDILSTVAHVLGKQDSQGPRCLRLRIPCTSCYQFRSCLSQPLSSSSAASGVTHRSNFSPHSQVTHKRYPSMVGLV